MSKIRLAISMWQLSIQWAWWREKLAWQQLHLLSHNLCTLYSSLTIISKTIIILIEIMTIFPAAHHLRRNRQKIRFVLLLPLLVRLMITVLHLVEWLQLTAKNTRHLQHDFFFENTAKHKMILFDWLLGWGCPADTRLLFWDRHAVMVQLVAYWYFVVHQPASAAVVGIGGSHQPRN
jgi:hypothetical protein